MGRFSVGDFCIHRHDPKERLFLRLVTVLKHGNMIDTRYLDLTNKKRGRLGRVTMTAPERDLLKPSKCGMSIEGIRL